MIHFGPLLTLTYSSQKTKNNLIIPWGSHSSWPISLHRIIEFQREGTHILLKLWHIGSVFIKSLKMFIFKLLVELWMPIKTWKIAEIFKAINQDFNPRLTLWLILNWFWTRASSFSKTICCFSMDSLSILPDLFVCS